MKNIYTFLTLLCILSCSKPDEVDSFKYNSIRATVNGKTLVFDKAIICQTKKLTDPLFQFSFIGSNGDDPDISPSILIRLVYPGGQYFYEKRGLTDNGQGTTPNPLGLYLERENSSGLEYIKSDTEVTRIAAASITELDTVNKTISGTFRFTSYDSTLGEYYEVTDGEFKNLKYKEE